jgi:hypothetical protein
MIKRLENSDQVLTPETLQKMKQTGEIFAVDPSVNDYLFIDFINYTK